MSAHSCKRCRGTSFVECPNCKDKEEDKKGCNLCPSTTAFFNIRKGYVLCPECGGAGILRAWREGHTADQRKRR